MERLLGNGRYELERVLGSGGMGVVYSAFDRAQSARVALKTLRQAGSTEIGALKTEFRSLAGVSHQNLVSFYELERDGDTWFITMELIEGVSLSELLDKGRPRPLPADGATVPGRGGAAPEARGITEPALPVDRIFDVFGQIARGLVALHGADKIHRDLKPSNVMVAATGRVVILDFGLIQPIGAGPLGRGGTPAYMSPEQVLGERLTEASDWYSFGVTLYKTLTCSFPFGGDAQAMGRAKVSSRAPSLVELLPSAPSHLTRLCDQLLARNPEERPTGADILLRLTGESTSSSTSARGATTPRAQTSSGRLFVGRERELEQLSRAFHRAERGSLAITLISGESGVGKSELIRHFLTKRRDRGAVILTGRCFERENLPYKLLDHLVDALATYLLELPADLVEVPVGTGALVQLFPILRSVPAFIRAPTKIEESALEMRQSGFAALWTILTRLRGPVIIWIDDVQWADQDSLGFLAEVRRRPAPVLFLLSSRSDQTPIHEWVESLRSTELVESVTRLELRPLELEDARALALSLVDRDDPVARARAERAAVESLGHPLLLGMLGADTAGAPATTLKAIVTGKVSGLERSVAELLWLTSIAARPLSPKVLTAAGESPEAVLRGLSQLRADRLLRSSDGREDRVEPYHDRVRELVLESLDDEEAKRLHARLAEVLELLDPEADMLAHHFAAAGEVARAASYALRAGDLARASLAFGRAAELYELALLAPESSGVSRFELLIRRAESLLGAGHGRDAGELFLEAADISNEETAQELRRRALGAYVLSGFLAESREAIRPALERVGLELPKSTAASIASAFLLQTRAKLVPFALRPSSASPLDRARLELLWDLARGFGMYDFPFAVGIFARHHLLARQVGDPAHILRGMSAALGPLAATGDRVKVDRARGAVEHLAEHVGTDDAFGQVRWGLGLADLFLGRWQRAYDGFQDARRLLRGQADSSREYFFAQTLCAAMCAQLGRLSELFTIIDEVLVEAAARGDMWSSISARTGFANLRWIYAGELKTARLRLAEAEELCRGRGYPTFDGYTVTARATLALANGDAHAAHELLDRATPTLKRNLFLRAEIHRAHHLDVLGRAALAEGGQRSKARAAKCAKRLARCKIPAASGLALVLEAGLAPADRAIQILRDAEARFEASDMLLHANMTRRRRGRLVGGDTGRALCAETERWASDQRVKDPDALADLLVPIPRT
ncbi:MAG: protein kinase [Deltaproteobacteria bacterium]|nr:protein kinase [Deltaproteobacteria bacterium]